MGATKSPLFFYTINKMNENTFFFTKIKNLCKTNVYTCTPQDSISYVANLMKEKNISGVIVIENNFPVGIVTDRDFRNKVIAKGLSPESLKISDIMSSPVFCVREEDFVFEAVYKMTKQNIHRLVVVDEMGTLKGIITDTDIIKNHTNTPLYFIRELEYVNNLDDLKNIEKKSIDFIKFLQKSGVRTFDLVRFISYLNDSVIIKTIELIIRDYYTPLTSNFSFLVLGSEGRMEQTLKTDQDNAIVYDDNLSDEEIKILEDFSERVIKGLTYIGIPECPGGIMAKNPFWRKSFTEWQKTLQLWISVPQPENTLNYSMFSDLRTIFGNSDMEKRLKEFILKMIQGNKLFLAHMAKNVMRFPPPISFFGNIRVEKSGPYKGSLDIKKSGIFPITEGIKILALDAGIIDGGTRIKIGKLLEKNALPYNDLIEVEASFSFLISLRLKSQLLELEKGKNPTNYIYLSNLNNIEKERLKIAFSTVKMIQSVLKDKYNLDQIS